MVLNYIGPNRNQGIQLYFNGVKKDGPGEYHRYSQATPEDDTVIIGKLANYFGSVAMDQLLFFNEKLTEDQIKELYEQGLPWL